MKTRVTTSRQGRSGVEKGLVTATRCIHSEGRGVEGGGRPQRGKIGFQNPNLESRGLDKNLANRARKARSLKHRARTDRLCGLPPHSRAKW
jgi:hypothetical protein